MHFDTPFIMTAVSRLVLGTRFKRLSKHWEAKTYRCHVREWRNADIELPATLTQACTFCRVLSDYHRSESTAAAIIWHKMPLGCVI